jgi:hypothetical protein
MVSDGLVYGAAAPQSEQMFQGAGQMEAVAVFPVQCGGGADREYILFPDVSLHESLLSFNGID